ncbi:ATP-binding protein [Proteiniphilum sp.]|uniref:AlbA family DNA-binding domain-containing protein n=1 Tax=Proteiniphilum sp. TaxID=1926877 RepID=UPI0033215E27
MSDKLNMEVITDLLKVKNDGVLYRRESQTLEFKESFNFAGLADYFRDFAAFSNNKGGYLIFGIKDRPKRELVGLSTSAKDQFEKLDPEMISGYINDIFSCCIEWEHDVFNLNGKDYAAFYVYEADMNIKPVICKKDEGKDNILKNGEIYYRYGGRTQKIQHGELEAIINRRIDYFNKQWIDLVQKIGKSGPQNAAILDTEKGAITKGENQILVVDEKLVRKIKWIKEGEFSEKKGTKTLKLIGEVQPVDAIEVVRTEKVNRLKEYPLSAKELANEIKKRNNKIGQNDIWRIIKENNIKSDLTYALYNFRNKSQEEEYSTSGKVSNGVPSIYKQTTVDYIIQIYINEI